MPRKIGFGTIIAILAMIAGIAFLITYAIVPARHAPVSLPPARHYPAGTSCVPGWFVPDSYFQELWPASAAGYAEAESAAVSLGVVPVRGYALQIRTGRTESVRVYAGSCVR
jgi:hypothetical protein